MNMFLQSRIVAIRLLLLLILTNAIVNAIEIDNGVVGTPSIVCGTDTISFSVNTRNQFKGKVYVKGEYNRDECVQSFSDKSAAIVSDEASMAYGSDGINVPFTSIHNQPAVAPPSTCPPCMGCISDTLRRRRQIVATNGAHLEVKIGTCNTRRDRTLSPPGVQISFTVVISFHENFITKVDRAYLIQCAYMETDRTVTSQIDVSMQPTTELTSIIEPPRCEYTIHRAGAGNDVSQVIRYAKVGDKVVHRWECTSTVAEMFGLLVHNCHVEDGAGQSEPVIDNNGCSLDAFVLPDLVYDSTRLVAQVETFVFKFADRAVLDFQCAITVCIRADGACDGLTPPKCDHPNTLVTAETTRKRRSANENNTEVDGNEWLLHAQRLTVVDLDDDINSNDLQTLENQLTDNAIPSSRYMRHFIQHMGSVCLSVAGFGILVATCTFVFTIAATVIGTMFVLTRTRQYTK